MPARSASAPSEVTRVVVLSGPSGAGKSRLARRLHADHGWPIVALDDFYLPHDAPDLPRLPGIDLPDWDHPDTWRLDAAVTAIEELATLGCVTVPSYSLSTSTVTGSHRLTCRDNDLIIAEGVFAPLVIAPLTERGLLHSAWCVARPRWITFWLRLTRDLVERRKPPLTLIRRGLLLSRREPAIVADHVAAGATRAHPRTAYATLRRNSADPMP